MIAQNVVSTKEIVITTADFDRLRGLMHSPRYRATRAAPAGACGKSWTAVRWFRPTPFPGAW